MNIYRLPTPVSTHYLNRYIKLITIWKDIQDISDNYVENHHILPESMGGLNTSDNMILLPARLHYLAHWMLWKAYKSREMTTAFFAMSNQNNQYQGRNRRITSRTYENLRKEFASLISGNTKELWKDPNYRQKHIDTNNKPETKSLRSQKAKDLWKNPDYVEKVLQSRKKSKEEGKYQFSESERKKRSLRASGDNNPAKRLEVREKNSGNNHYSKRDGYLKSICIYCGMTTTLTNIKRWHNDKCKYKN